MKGRQQLRQVCVYCIKERIQHTSSLLRNNFERKEIFMKEEMSQRHMDRIAEKPDDGTNHNGQPIAAGNGGSTNFRIPCLVTLQDDTLVAAADVRWDSEADGGGMDVIVSHSGNHGAVWNYTFANYLGDNGNRYDENSSTLMDPELATDGTKLYLLVDLFPAGRSSYKGNLEGGFGFTEEGYLRLKKRDEEGYQYYLKNGVICHTDGAIVPGYTIDPWFNLVRAGVIISNLFYANAMYQVYPTSYLCLTTSDDKGAVWSDPVLLHVKASDETFYGTGPGRGLVTADGTVMFSCYNGSYASVIYSKDQGMTWNRFGAVPGTESQLVELSDGTIRMFFRNMHNAICYADVVRQDGSYRVSHVINTGIANCSNCQISALRYSRLIDGKQAILVCCPTVVSTWAGRYNGTIFIFTLDENNHMTKAYAYQVNGRKEKEFFAYSCMTELRDGAIGLLYEDSCIRYQNAAQGVGYSRVVYVRFDISTLAPGAVIGTEKL